MTTTRNHQSADAWLRRNLSSEDAAYGASLLASPSTNFILRLLPAMLAIGAVVVAAMWYQEARLNLIGTADRIGYPLLLAATTLGALLLKFRPRSLRLVIAAVFFAYLAHLLAVYYVEMSNRIMTGDSSSYELTILALWLPLGYVGSFVFFSPRAAVRTSLAIYVAISLPQWVLLGIETDEITRQIAIAILISQPLYIAALWGVGMLKAHARGIHNLAKSMSEAATVDALTGVANRRAMDHVLAKVTQSPSVPDRPLALLMIDVDHFKRINDTYGHAAGDDVLIKLAHEANVHLRAGDLLGRWGGEEFMIIALDQTSASVHQMAERLRAALEKTTFPHIGTVTVSIGVTSFIPGEDVDAFINRADEALYQAKERGRNRVEGLFGNDR